jgi:hypothetical protein
MTTSAVARSRDPVGREHVSPATVEARNVLGKPKLLWGSSKCSEEAQNALGKPEELWRSSKSSGEVRNTAGGGRVENRHRSASGTAEVSCSHSMERGGNDCAFRRSRTVIPIHIGQVFRSFVGHFSERSDAVRGFIGGRPNRVKVWCRFSALDRSPEGDAPQGPVRGQIAP